MSGHIEIGPGWDDEHPFMVMDWSESGDSGWCAGNFKRRDLAVQFARAYSAETGRELLVAQIIPFPNGRAA